MRPSARRCTSANSRSHQLWSKLPRIWLRSNHSFSFEFSVFSSCQAAGVHLQCSPPLSQTMHANESPHAPGQNHLALAWFTRDLRLGDNEMLKRSAETAHWLLPVYVLSSQQLQPRRCCQPSMLSGAQDASTGLGVPKMGPFRCRVLLETLSSLRRQLRGGGLSSDLVYRMGAPSEQLPGLLQAAAASLPELNHVSLHYHLDYPWEAEAEEAQAAVQAVQKAAADLGVPCSVHTYWGLTLYHADDLPHTDWTGSPRARQGGSTPHEQPVCLDTSRFACMPGVMTTFRKAVQSASGVRPLIAPPTTLPPLPPAFTSQSQAAVSAQDTAEAAAISISNTSAGQTQPQSLKLGSLLQGDGCNHDSGSAGSSMASGTTHTAAGDCVQASNVVPHCDSGDIPTNVLEVYEVMGFTAELQRLAELTQQDLNVVPAAGSGMFDPRTAFPMSGGEEEGLARLHYYLHGAGGSPAPALHYFTNTRMQAVGVDNSTKLSAYLNSGALSPRQVYYAVKAAGQRSAAAQSLDSKHAVSSTVKGGGTPSEEAAWLIMHLCIRDFFMFTALKEGRAMMGPQGIKGQPVHWHEDAALFVKWSAGKTGLPFVDACMREIGSTGYMSNRGRQNVASFMAKDLQVDWRLGAELFESLLVDCDVGVNYSNWNYFAGVGNDLRNRHFNTVTQGMQYDADALLISAWLPQLATLPIPFRHKPFEMNEEEAHAHGFELGTTYPAPIIDPATQIGKGPKPKGEAGVLRTNVGPEVLAAKVARKASRAKHS